ncbi:MAG: hypothetical protein AAGA99_20365 [Actinomycetota bacterium]
MTDGSAPGPTDDADRDRRLLGLLRSTDGSLLGSGGEARVLGLDDERVLRILRLPTAVEVIRARAELLDELRRGRPAVAIPEVLEIGEHDGRTYTVERRVAGRPVGEVLRTLDRRGRDRLIEGHLDAVAALADLPLAPRPWFGELLGSEPLRSTTWRAYLVERAERSLRSSSLFDHVDAEAIVGDLPTGAEGCLVHLDAVVDNVLACRDQVTAVIDFGPTCARGARWVDAVSAVVYLEAPEITPDADQRDRAVARAWSRDRGLEQLIEPAERWLTAMWSFALEDPAVDRWCRRVLRG